MKIVSYSKLLLFTLSISTLHCFAQMQDNDKVSNLKIYRATPDKINDLVHTKLDVKFDYAKAYLYGKAWITLKPHFYPTDSLTLDAKGMDIKTVAIFDGLKNIPLKYNYDSLKLRIDLGKTYKSTDSYTVYISYTSKPNELKVKGSAAISDAKGLYFINPDSSIKGKPVQIWTQGETEGSSVWFPTIDHPNQKTTEEITMTVPAKYTTLSNGALISQKKNANGTRTDYWKMDKPHSPYLFMMAVGDFKVYHDKWKNIPVDYYLEPAYAPYAKAIFGKTPAMIDFYSKKLGIDYPWNKYAQIVVRDFVSGAMENTTATLHADYVQQTARELLDGSGDGESTIAHELFHHWFGDFVTAESWSNLSVNESFADFSETLWAEHAYGKDAGDAHNYEAMQSYLGDSIAKTKDLIRFHYKDKEDMFDLVSYQKGGRVLNMLRNYLGEDAFFKGLNLYLKTNALGNGEAHQLRLALEQVSGKDLNWFFNQWYFGAGNPILNIDYKWDNATKTQTIYLNQTQKEEVFKLPMKIDVYLNGKKETHSYWMTNKSDSISYQLVSKPDLVNVDADKVLLVKKNDHKSIEEFAFQYKNALLYVDRLEAIEAAAESKDSKGIQILISALNDPYFELRIKAIHELKLDSEVIGKQAIPILLNLAKKDQKTLVKAAAIEALASLRDSVYLGLFKESIKNPSYAVEGAALDGIAVLDIDQAMLIAKTLEKDSKGALAAVIVVLYTIKGTEADFPYVSKAFENLNVQEKFQIIPGFVSFLYKINKTDYIIEGVNQLKQLSKQYKTYGADKIISVMLENLLGYKKSEIEKANVTSKTDLETQVNYIQKAINEIKLF